jgi:hypothetical protein
MPSERLQSSELKNSDAVVLHLEDSHGPSGNAYVESYQKQIDSVRISKTRITFSSIVPDSHNFADDEKTTSPLLFTNSFPCPTVPVPPPSQV